MFFAAHAMLCFMYTLALFFELLQLNVDVLKGNFPFCVCNERFIGLMSLMRAWMGH